MNPENPQLNCLVLSKQHEHHRLVSTWLGERNCVGGVTAVTDEKSLDKHLNRARVHLCIVVMEKHQQSLPICMLHYSDVPVLVLTIGRKPSKRKTLFQQGACDVVSLRDSAAAKHAIKRSLNECLSALKLRFLQLHVEQLEKEVAHLRSILSSRKQLPSPTAANDAEHVTTDRVVATLKYMQQPVVENVISNYEPRDTATGLLARISVLKRFQQMLSSEIKAPRFTALLVSILADDSSENQSEAAKNVQNLTLYRAADALKKRLNTGTLLGRINQNALLVIQSCEDEPTSRDAANRVRDSLGSLGGLIDAKTDVHINTMNLPVKTRISANEVVARLEASAN